MMTDTAGPTESKVRVKRAYTSLACSASGIAAAIPSENRENTSFPLFLLNPREKASPMLSPD
jgi:hypothetical protein